MSNVSVALAETYWVSQKLPQICTASAQVYWKSILKQMQYIFAVTFGTLSKYQG